MVPAPPRGIKNRRLRAQSSPNSNRHTGEEPVPYSDTGPESRRDKAGMRVKNPAVPFLRSCRARRSMSLPNSQPPFDEREHIIYHSPTSPATTMSWDLQNVRACQEVSGYTLPPTTEAEDRATKQQRPTNISPLPSWERAGVRVMSPPGERQTGDTAHRGNATKCPQMPQKHDFHLSPSRSPRPLR